MITTHRDSLLGGCLEVVALLLNDRRVVDPSANNDKTIRWVSRKGHTQVVALLLNDKKYQVLTDKNINIRFNIICLVNGQHRIPL